MEVVIFPDRLYLTKVVIKDEMVIEGEVINGAWFYRVKDGKAEACYENNYDCVVNSWPYIKPEKLVYVPPERATYDYNSVINWACEQEGYTGSLSDLADMAEIDAINLKARYRVDDDDIPF